MMRRGRFGFLIFKKGRAGIFLALAAACGIMAGCGSSPKEDMWSLLARGDERAISYFMGEFDVTARDPNGRTPLHFAAALNDAPLTSFFIARGAEVDAQDFWGQTPLDVAAASSSGKSARVLVASGADIHRPGPAGASPVQVALLSWDDTLLKSLLTRESLIATDARGMTAL
ncbi:MAG: ankyrin repeat domain-containing protein, partial [Treponema sp.]|nr:ankyrin repeat domain-containing protein [Treponema sp.]